MREKKRNRVFGTDGVRARVGEFPLTEKLIPHLAHSINAVLPGSKVIIGRDTRESGKQIELLLQQGLTGVERVTSCGVVPTPGISHIIAKNDFDYGIMITASHNPFYDNGIKVFNCQGEKISAADEDKIEDIFFSVMREGFFGPTDHFIEEVEINDYKQFLFLQLEPLKNQKLKIVLDCANGATYKIAPEVLADTGFTTTVINSLPTGRNINEKCGSVSPDSLVQKVKTENAEIGIAFDGDGDRLVVADNKGHVLQGDHLLYLLAKYFEDTDPAGEKIVIGTIMSNGGLELSLAKMGYQLIRTDVGDKHVYQEMKSRNVMLGGEQAGHIILSRLQRTGDGILSAIYFLRALLHFNLHPGDVFPLIKLFPQVTRSFHVREKKDLASWSELQKMITEFNARCGKDSRVLIRYSGTEPKIRIMIESGDPETINAHLQRFEDLILSDIGG